MAKKKLNKRALFVIIVFGAIVLIGGVYIYIQQLPKDPGVYLARAQAYMTKSPPNYEEAVKMYFRAISVANGREKVQLQQQCAEALIEQVNRDLRLSAPARAAAYGQALSLLRRNIIADPTFLASRRLLAEHLWRHALSTQQRDMWQDFIEEVDRILETEQDAKIFYRRGFAKSRLGQHDKIHNDQAIEDFRRAIDAEPENVNYRLALARFLELIEKTEDAEQVIKDAIEAAPDKAQPRISYGLFLRRHDRKDESLKAIQEAIATEAENSDGYLALSEYYISERNPTEANKALQKAKEIDKYDIRIYTGEARIARAQNDIPKAVQALRNGLATIEESRDNDQAMTKIPFDQARALLTYRLADAVMDMYLREADPKLKAKYLQEAKELHDVLLKLSPRQAGQFKIAGRIAYAEGKWEQARKDFEQSMSGAFDLPTAVALIDVYKRLNLPTRGEKLTAQILQIPGQETNTFFLLQRAQFRMDARDYAMADQLLDRVESIDSDNKDVAQLREAIRIATGKSTGSGEVSPLGRYMMLRRADDLINADKFGDAQKLLQKLLSADPKDMQAMSALLRLWIDTGQQARAVEQVQKALKNDPDNKNLQRWLALLNESDPQKRFQIELNFAAKNDNQLAIVLGKWAICRRYNKDVQAREYIREAEKINPDNSTVIEALFNYAIVGNDWEQARAIVNRLEASGNVDALLYAARLKVARKEYADAIALLEEVLEQHPHLQMVRLMLSDCYFNEKQYDEAKAQYERVVANDAKNVLAMLGLARLAEIEQKFDEHDQWILQAYMYPAGKNNRQIKERYLQSQVEPKNITEAIKIREKTFGNEPGNLGNVFRLALLYEKNKQLDKALEMLEYFYKNTTNPVSFAPVLANFYSKTGSSSKADAMFQELLSRAEDSKEKIPAYIAYGNFLAKVDPQAAKAMFENAIKADPVDARGLKALANLYAMQARLLAGAGDASASRTFWNKVFITLKEVIDLDLQDMQSRIVLSELYLEAGRPDDAIKGYQELLKENPQNIQAVLGLGLAYLKNDQLNDAMDMLARALEINPNLADAYRLRAQVHIAQGQLQLAVEDYKQVLQYISNPNVQIQLARLYMAMGKEDLAAQIYNQILVTNENFLPAYRGMMDIFRARQEWANLERLAQRGAEKFSDHPYFPLVLSNMWAARGDKGKQIELLGKALAKAPDDTLIIGRYLLALFDADKYDQLISDSDKYQTIPDYKGIAMAFKALATAKKNSADKEKAFGMFMQALGEIKRPDDIFFIAGLMRRVYLPEEITARADDLENARPKNWRVYAIIGEAYLRMDPPKIEAVEQAFKQAKQYCRSARDKVAIFSREARLYERIHRYDELEILYRKILKLSPDNPVALNNLAYLYVNNRNEPGKARQLIERAMRLQPANDNLIDTYAWTLAKLGEYDKALSYFTSLIEKGYSNATVLYHMGYVLEKTNDTQGAEGYYRRAFEYLKNSKDSELYETVQQALKRVQKTS